ncbi:MAG: translation initiation factor IF-2 [Nanoarchaeota archaeon]|nr:translation initiation factor IF-2 [Nanoarchaeota archaeon]MBU1030579.1 translation initiation factor IF-2 [Nanoarchaeota archaeon]MBU1849128.1 translation initiation factor IF-2 [Nanoarchaeota archaeon]
MTTRSPIVSVLGHVDHGKSSILDSIRGSSIVKTEAGAITQAIGASIIPMDVIKQKCGSLLETMKIKFTIPGILFIDTPGHAAFTTLRKRGGNLADIAVLVIDINEGFKPQTIEAIEILRALKTPFIIAANKMDLIPGYNKKKDYLIPDIKSQDSNVQTEIDKKIYELVGQLHERFGIVSERFDRVESYTKQVAIIPCSATQKIGLSELLMVLAGLAQKYLEENLKIDVSGFTKGTILEVKEEKGLGTTIDVIIYDGTLKVNDTIVIGSLDEPKVTKVRALFEPKPLTEMRDKKGKFYSVKEVFAATGVKISSPDFEDVIAGMPIVSCNPENIEKAKEIVQKEVKEVIIETEKSGIVIKADTIGSLEAMIQILKGKKISIRKASIGNITKKDYADAESNYEKDPLKAVILGFNISDEADVCSTIVKVLVRDVIYKLIDDFEEWQALTKKSQEAKKLEAVVRPCKLEILPNCIFRQNNPCIVGVDVVTGVVKVGTPLTKNGSALTIIKSMQCDKENVKCAEKGKQLAISLPNVTAGRQIFEHDILYSDVSEEDFRKLKKLTEFLTKDEISVLKEIAEIKRKNNPVWGV